MVVRLLVITVNTGLWTALVALTELILVRVSFTSLSTYINSRAPRVGRQVPQRTSIHSGRVPTLLFIL